MGHGGSVAHHDNHIKPLCQGAAVGTQYFSYSAPQGVAKHGMAYPFGGDDTEAGRACCIQRGCVENKETPCIRAAFTAYPSELGGSLHGLATLKLHLTTGRCVLPGNSYIGVKPMRRLTRCKLNTVLNSVALVMNLHTLGQKTLAPFGATAGEDGAAVLGGHAGTEAELALAAALGRLVCSLAHNIVFMVALKKFLCSAFAVGARYNTLI